MNGTKYNIEKFFSRQLNCWNELRLRYEALKHVALRQLGSLELQYNPERIVSTGAKIDRFTIAHRACFLCRKNRPHEQLTIDLNDGFELMVNPFPVLPMHFTIVRKTHVPQTILSLNFLYFITGRYAVHRLLTTCTFRQVRGMNCH